jgi:anti-sigma factor RsiW
MTCAEAEILLHALLDDELDAGHAFEVEAHLATCRRCAAQLRAYRELQQAMPAAQLGFAAPMSLRRRVEAALPPPPTRVSSRRSVLKSFAMGSALSAAMAATLVVAVIRTDRDQRALGDALSAHLRSLQGEHLTDVQTSDQHTVKPWFNGRLDVAPPVVDLTAQGFRLIGGRLDYIDGRAVAAIVYRRRTHVINLFIAPAAAAGPRSRRSRDLISGAGTRMASNSGPSATSMPRSCRNSAPNSKRGCMRPAAPDTAGKRPGQLAGRVGRLLPFRRSRAVSIEHLVVKSANEMASGESPACVSKTCTAEAAA